MDIIIKKLTNNPKQISDVQKFLFRMIKLEFGYGYIPKWHQDIMDMVNFYINPKKNNFFIAYDEKTNEILATIGIRSYDKNFPKFKHLYSNEKTSSIWRLFVDKKYRRCGLASKMFSIAENFAKNAGFKDIYLHTHKTLDGAIEFWTKMGFVIVLDENNNLQTVHMDKQINELQINPSHQEFQYAVKL